MIRIVKDELTANKCDDLLTELIQDERKYDDFIIENFKVKDYFKNIIKDDKNILLCFEDKENIIGYIFFKYQFQDNRVGYLIDGLYVKEEFRNQGIAKSLINKGLDIINNQKIDFIDINVKYENIIAIKLYESFGFKTFSIKMRKNGI